jgi:dihydrodipicolinate reductase
LAARQLVQDNRAAEPVPVVLAASTSDGVILLATIIGTAAGVIQVGVALL